MPFLATGKYRIERGSGTDEFGDDTNVATSRQRGLLGSVIEQSRNTFDPATGRSMVVRSVAGRFPAHSDIQGGDRVIDEADESKAYTVVDAHEPANPLGLGDVVCLLTRDTAA